MVVDYPPNTTNNGLVWGLDGNVEYGIGWHGALVALSFIFLLLFGPYTVLLFSSHWLYKIKCISQLFHKTRWTSWMNIHHAPFKADSRYWVGFGLLLRWFWLGSYSFAETTTSFNLLVTATICIVILSIIGTIWWNLH